MAVSLKWTVTPTYTSTKCTVKVTLKAVSTYGSWAASASGSISIGGTSYSFSHGYSANTTTTLATKSKTISLTTSKQTIKIAASFATGTSSGTVKKSDTITIAARPTYTVTFNANGGTKTSKVTVLNEATTKFPSAGTRTGYKMLGWASSASALQPAYSVGANTPQITSSRTYYAVWQRITYTATFNVNGGTGTISSGSSYYNATYTFPSSTPEKTNYVFVGWSTNKSATQASYVSGKSITWKWTANQIFYAVYIEDDIDPVIEDLSAVRVSYDSSSASYIQDDQSEQVYLSFEWVAGATSTGGYSSNTSISATIDGTSVYSSTSTSDSGTVALLLNDEYALDEEFTLIVTITDDDNGGSATLSTIIPKGGYPVAISPEGKAIALFGTADDEKPGFSLYNEKSRIDENGNFDTGGRVKASGALSGASLSVSGNGSVGGKLTVTGSGSVGGKFSCGYMTGFASTTSNSRDNFSIAANSATSTTVNVTKSGYYPFAMAGFNLANASSSGANVGSVAVYAAYMSARADGSCTVTFKLRNYATSAAKIQITVYVLWLNTIA